MAAPVAVEEPLAGLEELVLQDKAMQGEMAPLAAAATAAAVELEPQVETEG